MAKKDYTNGAKTVEEQDKSDFDHSLAALWRLSQIKQNLISKMVQNDYLSIGTLLKSYYFELRCVLKEEDQDELDKRYKKFSELFYQYKKTVMNSSGRVFNVKTEVLLGIDEFYLHLQGLAQDYNMNIRKKEDGSHIM